MPRKIWFRKSTGHYYTQFRRKQVRLAATEAEAKKVFKRLVAEEIDKVPLYLQKLTVRQICKAYLRNTRKNHSPDTRDWYLRYLRQFCRVFGKHKAAALKADKVETWLNAKKSVPVGRSKNGEPRNRRQLRWSSSTKNSVVTCLRSVFNWAVKKGLLLKNPLSELEKPPMERRERILSQDERRAILGAIKDRGFKMYLYALGTTGARPGEVARVTAENVDLGQGTWVFKKHKTSKRTKKPRVVYLTPPMVKLCARLMREHPEGPLFPNTHGEQFTRQAIRCRFRRIRQKLGLAPGVVAYTSGTPTSPRR